jgi:very-short-patch-repair endonuclease
MKIIQPYAPYHAALTERARELRRQDTPAEKILWETLKGRKLLGYKFTRQKPILGYIVDFYCAELLLIIEVDGSIHDETGEYDTLRSDELRDHGFHLKRYRNEDIDFELSNVIKDLTQFIQMILVSH